MLMSRRCGAEILGQFELAMSVLGLVPFIFVTGSNVIFIREIKRGKEGDFYCMCGQTFGLTVLIGFAVVISLFSREIIELVEGVFLMILMALTFMIRIGSIVLQSERQPHYFFLGDNNFSNLVMLAFVGGVCGTIYGNLLAAKFSVSIIIYFLLRDVSWPKAEAADLKIFQMTSVTSELFLSGVFFFLKALSTGGILFLVSFSASLAEVGVLGVLLRIANISGLGLVLLSPKYAVDIANISSYNIMSSKLANVRGLAFAFALICFLTTAVFAAEFLDLWGVSGFYVDALLWIVGGQVINGLVGPVGVIMAHQGRFNLLILISTISLGTLLAFYFYWPSASILHRAAVGIFAMQITDNCLKHFWWKWKSTLN